MKATVNPIIVLTLICALLTAALYGGNLLTKDNIARQKADKAERAMREVLPEAEAFTEHTQDDSVYFVGENAAGETMGYVFTTSAKGYGGGIQVTTGISAEGEIVAVTLLSHSETPGLGTRAGEESFLGQFKKPIPTGGFNVVKGDASGGDEIAAVTGATVSSKAVTEAVNQAYERYKAVTGKGEVDNG